MKKHVLITVLTLLCMNSAYPHEGHEAKKQTPNAQFERLKGLVGKWEGTAKTPKGDEKVTLTYELTGGGSALMERLFSGQPQEMISMYTQDGDQVVMTHYCAEGNQPTLQLKSSDKDSMKFEFVRGMAMNPKKDMHIHALSVQFSDADHIHQEWVGYKDGKVADRMNFSFQRTK